MSGFGKGCCVKCAVTEKWVTLLTSRAANFHVAFVFCFITSQITAVRNVEIHFGGGSDCIEVGEK